MSNSKKVVPATFQIGFIPGFSAEPGKSLGSRLLGTLRDSDALMLVVRADEDHDPAGELAKIEEELVIDDLGSVEQRITKQRRASKGDKSALVPEIEALERVEAALGEGTPIYRSALSDADRAMVAPVFLLTNKPAVVVVNIGVDQLADADALAAPFGDGALAVCLELEGDPDVVAADGRGTGVAARRPRCPRERDAPARRAPRCTCSGGARSSRRAKTRVARVDVPGRRHGARMRGRHPLRPPTWLHPRRGRSTGRSCSRSARGRRPRTSASSASRARTTW